MNHHSPRNMLQRICKDSFDFLNLVLCTILCGNRDRTIGPLFLFEEI